ncbi:MAG TPA: YchJ family metal-binding protein, partial [Kofleriaceae bacterium]|nr:YchJ family metal-binding protein [Kofleriaceae bacterium]
MARTTAADASVCPCGTGAAYRACCGRFHAGAPAPTALELMRSRYSAYALGEIDYLVDTHDPETRASMDVAAAAQWSRDTDWAGLEIVASSAGGAADDDGVVEFIARGATRGPGGRSEPFTLHERSRFRRDDTGRWVYIDGQTQRAAPAKAVVTPGRNE